MIKFIKSLSFELASEPWIETTSTIAARKAEADAQEQRAIRLIGYSDKFLAKLGTLQRDDAITAWKIKHSYPDLTKTKNLSQDEILDLVRELYTYYKEAGVTIENLRSVID